MANRRANPDELVRRNTWSHATPAYNNDTLGPTIQHRAAYGFREIRIVRWVFVERSNVQHRVPQPAQHVTHGVFQLETRVVRPNHDFHRRLTFPSLLLLPQP